MEEKLIVGLIGVVTGFFGALLKSWLDSRLKLDEETRKERWEVYKKLWTLTKCVPKWPREESLTYLTLLDFSKKCRDWYFIEGGFHLSRPARKAYGRMQDALGAALKGKAAEAAKVKEHDYNSVQQAGSALRTQLTLDLHSRQRGALYYFGA
jgi:hypothetical protein